MYQTIHYSDEKHWGVVGTFRAWAACVCLFILLAFVALFNCCSILQKSLSFCFCLHLKTIFFNHRGPFYGARFCLSQFCFVVRHFLYSEQKQRPSWIPSRAPSSRPPKAFQNITAQQKPGGAYVCNRAQW